MPFNNKNTAKVRKYFIKINKIYIKIAKENKMNALDKYAKDKIQNIISIINPDYILESDATRDMYVKPDLLIDGDVEEQLKNFIIEMYNNAFEEGIASVEGYDPEIDRD